MPQSRTQVNTVDEVRQALIELEAVQLRGLFHLLEKATADSTVSNTTVETDFSTTHTVEANAMGVGQVYRIRASGILSTV